MNARLWKDGDQEKQEGLAVFFPSLLFQLVKLEIYFKTFLLTKTGVFFFSLRVLGHVTRNHPGTQAEKLRFILHSYHFHTPFVSGQTLLIHTNFKQFSVTEHLWSVTNYARSFFYDISNSTDEIGILIPAWIHKVSLVSLNNYCNKSLSWDCIYVHVFCNYSVLYKFSNITPV